MANPRILSKPDGCFAFNEQYLNRIKFDDDHNTQRSRRTAKKTGTFTEPTIHYTTSEINRTMRSFSCVNISQLGTVTNMEYYSLT